MARCAVRGRTAGALAGLAVAAAAASVNRGWVGERVGAWRRAVRANRHAPRTPLDEAVTGAVAALAVATADSRYAPAEPPAT